MLRAINPLNAHCFHMGSAIEHPVPDRVKRHLQFLTFGHSDAQGNVKNYK